MTLNKDEIMILCSGLEIAFTKNETLLNEKGIKELAKIYCKLTSKVLPINPEDILGVTTERMLNNINYKKE